jgi:kynurenine formamidase
MRDPSSLSNWGRWGDTDERGSANLIDAEVVLDALRLPTQGRVYNLGIPIRRDTPVAGNRLPPLHLMSTDGGDFAARGLGDLGSADDYVVMNTHAATHVDALSHMWYGGELYNGFPFTEVRSSGAARCGVEKIGGLVTRGHLLDFVNRRCSEPGEIGPADVESYLEESGQIVRPGDAMLFRTGWIEAHRHGRVEEGSFNVVSPDLGPWLARHDVALIGADNEAVERAATPGDYPPLHLLLLRDLGTYIVELLDLSEPAADGVKTGLFVIAPLPISRGIGSPINPLLIV